MPTVTLVVPGINEAESLPLLAAQVKEALGPKVPYELIFVDDGSTDDSWQVIRDLHASDSSVRGVRLRTNFGKAMALAAGFERARADIVVTMDADLQDDPADLPKMIERIEGGLDVVVGWKVERRDPLNRRIFSRIFNNTVGYVTGVRLHDMNCGFKAYRREVLRSIPIYGDLFRFIPVLAAWQGFSVGEIPVNHRARQFGQSRYGLERILRGFFDLLSVSFLTKYSRKPMHLFGFLGLVFTFIGLLISGYLSVLWIQGESIGSRPLLLLGVLLILVGVQSFSIGLLGEFMTFQYERKQEQVQLPIREVVGDPR
ncbi:MAG: glycosyltransferase family 2 protein [Deltaproteobacteria bacterium]|nr:glycosyltransferase family 2 protein [Deltaproteobacteria bacterium]MBW2222807.1 glycosyltransferase family 2 protein [Deltaproteobacteria bacterium]MBW2404653.1 glycosyltransferase family 2 protein [Deltaproteobacteria bacterium]MBW2546230.1 glycosyltransferase family 2 protein [Deltaproteobacteria bacterium]MBW2717170.1 glycosyltransferase family 2 protein [Deltaproteobacteria bacterium]